MLDFSKEIKYQTTRSGGKGGQNVNKVETAVIGTWLVIESSIINEAQKQIISAKLSNRINNEGYLVVKSQTHRSQLGNKEEVTERINNLLNNALIRKKARIATRTSKAAKERRIESKKRRGDIKEGRKPFKGDY